MIKNLIHDPLLLSKKSIGSNKGDKQTDIDLLDTLTFYKDTCAGMAANMIGVYINTIIFTDDDGKFKIMHNPVITEKHFEYEATESCLSYKGKPKNVKRYKVIKVKYEDENFKPKTGIYQDFTAQIIQHEIDHTKGILV